MPGLGRMALSTKLELRQGQQLVMTPQLQQAIRLLQLSNLEIGQFVEAELERNPLLEMDEPPEVPAKVEATAETESNGEAISESNGEAAGDGADGADGDAWLDLAEPV